MIAYSRKLFFVMMVVVMVLEGAEHGVSGMSKSECSAEVRMGVNACKTVLYGELPTPKCCERVRVSHEECVCPLVTPKLAALINLNKAIRLIQGCGRRVPRHHTCGSITTP